MDIFGEEVLSSLSTNQLTLLILVQVWDLIWKAFALWRAARKRDIFWFVLLILINSAGLLPAFYLFYISERPKKKGSIVKKLSKSEGEQKDQKKSVKKDKTKKTAKKK